MRKLCTGLLFWLLVGNLNALDFKELEDVVKVYDVHHKIDDQGDRVNVSIGYGGSLDMVDEYMEWLKKRGSVLKLHDKVLQRKLLEYMDATAENYQILQKAGEKSDEFKKSCKLYGEKRQTFVTFLLITFDFSKYVSFSEAYYWEHIDKGCYTKNPLYGVYQKHIKAKKYDLALKLIDRIIERTQNFQEKSIYLIEKFDLFVKYEEHLTTKSEDLGKEAIKGYLGIIDSEQYSLYLFETWRKWRSVSQCRNGSSRLSEIPNEKYYAVRKKVVKTILDYLKKNPSDEMAVNQFFQISTSPIIKAVGDYSYGNDNVIEYHQLFKK